VKARIIRFAVRYEGLLRMALVASILFIVLFILSVRVAPWIMTSLGQQWQIVEDSKRVDRGLSVADEAMKLDTALVEIQAMQVMQAAGGGSSRVLQEILGAAKKCGVAVSDLQATDPVTKDGLSAHPVRFRGQGHFIDVEKLLRLLETGALVVSIEDLDMKPTQRTGESIEFTVALTVYLSTEGKQ